jgi:flagellar biosynthetic protein FliR
MQIIDFITDKNAITFILLFSRISSFFAFMPFFSHANISVTIKTALTLYLTILLFPISTTANIEINTISMIMMVFGELTIGFLGAFLLNMAYSALSFAGSQISMVMGFSMATLFDPITGTNSPLISQILTLIALLFFLAFDGHHLILLYLSQTVNHIELGSFYPQNEWIETFITSVSMMFKMGLVISFPIIALSLLSDIIFGMLMKTMPQFNLLVVGFPIKIFLSTLVLMAILGSMMILFKDDFLKYFEALKLFF